MSGGQIWLQEKDRHFTVSEGSVPVLFSSMVQADSLRSFACNDEQVQIKASSLKMIFHKTNLFARRENSAKASLKASLHYQSFCDHSRNFASVNSKFGKICKKCLRKLTQC